MKAVSMREAAGRLMAVMAAVTATAASGAVTFTKVDNALPLNDPGSWSPAGVPGASDTGRIDHGVMGPLVTVLGGDLRWSTLEMTGAGGDVRIAADGHALGLQYLYMQESTRNLTLENDLRLWDHSSFRVGNTLTLGGVMMPAEVKGSQLQLLGAGTVVWGGTLTPSSQALPFQIWTSQATLVLASGRVLNSASNQLWNGGVLDLGGYHAVTGAGNVGIGGTVTNSAPTPARFTVANGTQSSSITMPIIVETAGVISFVKQGSGTLGISSVQQYSGTTTLAGGILELKGSVDVLPEATALVMGGGTLSLSSVGSHTFPTTTLAAGASTVRTPGPGSLGLGTLVRQAGSTLVFELILPTKPGRFYSSAPLTSSGILGGWAVAGGWATRDTASAVSQVVPLAAGGYASAFAPGVNTKIGRWTKLTAPANSATGSVYFADGSGTLALGGANVIESGGILVGGGAAGSEIVPAAPGATLTSGNGADLIVHQFAWPPADERAALRIGVPIVDNGTTPIALTKSGPGMLILSGANTYSGGTYLLGGSISVTSGEALGMGPVTIARAFDSYSPLASQLLLAPGITYANDIFLRDDDIVRGPSLIDVRGVAATLSGDVTAVASAANQYRMGTGAELTLTGTHTAGAAAPAEALLGIYFTGAGRVTFAGNGSLTAYQQPVMVGTRLVLQDDAIMRIRDVAGEVGLSIGVPTEIGVPGAGTLTLQDRAHVDLGTRELDLYILGGGVPTLNLDGGTLTLGAFRSPPPVNYVQPQVMFNGTTIVATRDAGRFFSPHATSPGSSAAALVSVGGARFDTAGHAIGVGFGLQHDPLLGAAADGGLTKLGAGTLTLAGTGHTFTGPLTVVEGTVRLATPGALKVRSLAGGPMAGAGRPAWASLDLGGSKLILQTTGDADKTAKVGEVLAAIHSARDTGTGGRWTGQGITSATAAADPERLTVGLFDNADLDLALFGGAAVDGNSLLLAVVPAGDATVDGRVDLFDLKVVAEHWQASSNFTDSQGDFTQDGRVDAFDLNVLAGNWQFGVGAGGMMAAVPEPTGLGILLGGLGLLVRRRGRRGTRG